MQNPFLVNRLYSISYGGAWILLLGLHVSVLHFFSDQSLSNSLIDGFVFNLIFALIGLGIWFAVHYYDSSRAALMDTILYHLGTAVVALAVWLGLAYFILRNFIPGFADYQIFLEESIPWRAISGIFLYSLMVMVYYLYINQEDRKARISKEAELQLQVREAEIDRLKSQINPHFIFNSLNSISSLTLKQPEKAREMIIKLSSFLRSSLEFRENELTDLSTELDHIRQYLEIEKVRFGDKLLFDFDVPKSCENSSIPNMILQPLFENAIKHGVYESTEPVEIITKVSLKSNNLIVAITNDYDPEMPSRKGKGIGIQNVHNRMQLVYQSSNLLQLKKTEGRFTAELIIPQK
jgi:two-component system LytT family sensor kinase